MVGPDDEVFAITSAGGVIRTTAAEIKQSGRQTMGVRLVNLATGQTLVAIARNAEEPESAMETTVTNAAAGRCQSPRRQLGAGGAGGRRRSRDR